MVPELMYFTSAHLIIFIKLLIYNILSFVQKQGLNTLGIHTFRYYKEYTQKSLPPSIQRLGTIAKKTK